MRRQGRGLGPGTIKGVAAGCAVAVAGGVATKGAKPADAATAEEQAISQQLLAFNNQERAARGLPPLAFDGYAAGQAQDWAHRMRSGGRISHRPNLSSAFAAYPAYGENVGETGHGAGTLHRLWMGSAAHRRNQLQAGFDAAGVGVACAPDGRMWVAVDYVGRSSAVASRYTSSVAAPSPVVVGAPGLRCPQPVGAATVGTPGTGGYWLAASDGGVFAFGDVGFLGSAGGRRLNAPVMGMAASPSKRGYWLGASDGGVFAFGDARFHGSMGGRRLNAPITGIAASPSGRGYWEVASDGGVFAFGESRFYGSMGGQRLNAPITGIAPSPSGRGYWEVASDGGVFAFGDARFYGSMGGRRLNAPIAGIAATPSGRGYWLVASDGGVFAFGDARFYGSMGGRPLRSRIVGIAATPSGRGYRLFGADGGVFTFGDASYRGSTASVGLKAPVVAGTS